MRKILLTSLAISFFALNLNAQEVDEPEFIGESLLLRSDNTTVLLEKELTQGRTVASTGLVITGIGKVRSQIQINGCCAGVKVSKDEDIKIIIRGVDNMTDPISIIKVFKFDSRRKFRRAELSSAHIFGSYKNNNLDYVRFTGTKFGTSSYLLEFSDLEPGEYGITISNPNNIDEKQIVISTFAVTE